MCQSAHQSMIRPWLETRTWPDTVPAPLGQLRHVSSVGALQPAQAPGLPRGNSESGSTVALTPRRTYVYARLALSDCRNTCILLLAPSHAARNASVHDSIFCLYSPQAGVAALILVVAFGRWRGSGGALGGPRAASKNGGLPSEAAIASSECGTATCAPLLAAPVLLRVF